MLEKLNQIEKHYEELAVQLADPEVLSDRQRFQKVAKEHKDLEDVVETYRRLKGVDQELEDNNLLMKESDPDIREMAKEEIPILKEKREALIEELKVLLLPRDPNDEKNVIVEIRAGTGGEEAALFVADLFRMYGYYAEANRWTVEVMNSNSTELGGFKEIVFGLTGKDVFSKMKYESGVHRVQRVPDTESQGRIHTSAVTVAVLVEAEDVEVEVREEDLRIDVYRSQGAGGQHVNTTDSAVRITHIPTGLVVSCQDERSQIKNRSRAMKILKARLYEIEQQRQQKEEASLRKSMVGSGDRSERIRTYNFPQGRLSDHRIGLTLYKLQAILMGDMEELVVSLRTFYQAEALKQSHQ